MTLFQDVAFFVLLAVLLVPAFFLGATEEKRGRGNIRAWYILAASVLFDALAIGRDPEHILFFLLYLLWETLTVSVYVRIRQKSGRKGKIYAVFLILSIAPLVLSKVSGFFPVHLFQVLGISYLTFKSAQVVIEIYDGVITQVILWILSAFWFSFPAS